MERANFKSSNLKAMEYDQGTLKIFFNAGPAYEYYNVPHEVVVELQYAQSAGKYFAKFIKGKFPFRRIS